MISHGKDIKVFCGNSNPKLAKEICQLMGTKLGRVRGGDFLRRRDLFLPV